MKVKVTITAIIPMNPEFYPECKTAQEMIDFDQRQSGLESIVLYLEDADYVVTGEEVVE